MKKSVRTPEQEKAAQKLIQWLFEPSRIYYAFHFTVGKDNMGRGPNTEVRYWIIKRRTWQYWEYKTDDDLKFIKEITEWSRKKKKVVMITNY